MLRLHLLLVVLLQALVFTGHWPAVASLAYDPSTALLLDAYLDNSTTREEGRTLSLVTSLPTVYSSWSHSEPTSLPFTVHSGYFAVSPVCSLFFQLYSPTAAPIPGLLPLIVFLAGGPGVAASYWSLYGGVTPLTFTTSPDPRLLYHNQSWAEDAHVLLVDSPIGVGFSQCRSEQPVRAANNSAATAHLVTFIGKFLTLYPSFLGQSMYIAGHSYGGRSAPDLAAALQDASYVLGGVIVESGVTESYLSFSEACNGMYLRGLSNHTERQQCNSALDQLKAAVGAKDEAGAQQAVHSTLSMVLRANAGNAYQDFQRSFDFADVDAMSALLTSADMRLALHAGSDTPYAAVPGYSFTDHWSGESVTALDTVLSDTDSRSSRVLYFASNSDSLLGSSAQRLLAATAYNGRVGWEAVRPEPLKQAGSNVTRGLLKRSARLWFATLYDAGHMISIVQPTLTRQLIGAFTGAWTQQGVAASSDSHQPIAAPLTQRQRLLPSIHRGERTATVHEAVSAEDVLPAVYLTPYLSRADGPALAQQASAVSLPHSAILAANSTYSGYITVDAAYNSHSFFWFLPSLDKNASAPLLLHLSGGPGISSMAMGFLYQHGPFSVDYSTADPLDTTYRADNYNEHNHVLYVDNPIGTGFSYTEDPRGFRNDSRQVADDLYELLRQFYQLFPGYRSCRLYVHGVSYAGHFLPTLGWKIHMENSRRGRDEQMPFEGLFVASGWMDAPSQTSEENAFFQTIGRMDLTHTDQLVGCDNSYCDLDWSLDTSLHPAAAAAAATVSRPRTTSRSLALCSSRDCLPVCFVPSQVQLSVRPCVAVPGGGHHGLPQPPLSRVSTARRRQRAGCALVQRHSEPSAGKRSISEAGGGGTAVVGPLSGGAVCCGVRCGVCGVGHRQLRRRTRLHSQHGLGARSQQSVVASAHSSGLPVAPATAHLFTAAVAAAVAGHLVVVVAALHSALRSHSLRGPPHRGDAPLPGRPDPRTRAELARAAQGRRGGLEHRR